MRNMLTIHIEHDDDGGVTTRFHIDSMDEPILISNELLLELGVSDPESGSRLTIGGFTLLCLKRKPECDAVLYWPLNVGSRASTVNTPQWFKEFAADGIAQIMDAANGSTPEPR